MEGSVAVLVGAVRPCTVAAVEVTGVRPNPPFSKYQGGRRCEDPPETRGDAEHMRRDEADVSRGARSWGSRVHERRLDERAALAVEAAAACMSASLSWGRGSRSV